MTLIDLVRRSLLYHWRPNLAVTAGVATAVAVLAGALVVGDSVRQSLRRMAVERLGATETVIQSSTLFREALAESFGNAAPMIVLEGLVSHQGSGKRAAGVALYGVDSRFWKFHGKADAALANRDAALSPALAAELGAQAGDTLLLRIEKPSDIPAESLFGRKEETAPTIRLNLKSVLPPEQMGEFSLQPKQTAVRAIFVPLARVQREAGAPGRVNVLLTGATATPPDAILRESFALEDLGIRLRALEDRDAIQFDTASGIIDDKLADAVRQVAGEAGLSALPFFTYMATGITAGGRLLPYSLIAATDLAAIGIENAPADAIVFNDWAAADLGAKPGAPVSMEFLVWRDDGTLATGQAGFVTRGTVRMAGLAGDRDLTPEYPGITDADNVADWDPPFPMDLSKIRPRDEDYWDRYRTTPKAWIPLARAQQLWNSRWGKLTAFRLAGREGDEGLNQALHDFRVRLRRKLNPADHGLAAVPVRQQNLAASRGATDFGEYFSYFSFFLMVSALLLAGLFFRLGLEQRFPEVGLLRAAGFTPSGVRRLFLTEGALLALAGGVCGALAAALYAKIVLYGLGTWWVDAVGTRDLALHLSPRPVLSGVAGGVGAAVIAVLATLRGIRDVSPKRLLSGGDNGFAPAGKTRAGRVAMAASAIALLLAAATLAGSVPAEGGFFGVGLMVLAASLAKFRAELSASLRHRIADGAGFARLAFRNAGFHPGRTVLTAALLAAATFLIVSVEAFRRDPAHDAGDPQSGTGGYPLFAESVRPLYYNPNSNLEDLRLSAAQQVKFVPMRLRPGDDASCLNLYRPENPRVLGLPADFLKQRRFRFAASEGSSGNPWSLLEQERADGAIPAAADANSLQYVLHKSVGEEITVGGARLRIVAALADSLFQSELLISEANFLRAYPRQQGYRVFLIDAPEAQREKVTASLESALADHGFDVTPAGGRLAAFHRVENTYLSTFQTLGGLGLLLGTIGLAAVLFRNVLERRRELGLLTAVGYSKADLGRLVLTENLATLAAGLFSGILAACLAIAPVLASRGVGFSVLSMGALLAGVFAAGAAAVILATRAAMRLPLISSLRAG